MTRTDSIILASGHFGAEFPRTCYNYTDEEFERLAEDSAAEDFENWPGKYLMAAINVLADDFDTVFIMGCKSMRS